VVVVVALKAVMLVLVGRVAAVLEGQLEQALLELPIQVAVGARVAIAVVVKMAVLVALVLLLLAPLLRRHLPQVLQQSQQAAAEQFIHLQHLVQLHSEVKHESLRKSC
jgi:hypothetical protein